MFERLTARQLKEESCCRGVTLAQCHTILEIEELGQATTVELSKRLGLDKSTLSRTIDSTLPKYPITKANDYQHVAWTIKRILIHLGFDYGAAPQIGLVIAVSQVWARGFSSCVNLP